MKIANLQYVDQTKTLIDMDVTLDKETANQYHAAGDTIRYTYHPGDTALIALAIRKLLSAKSYKIAPYVVPKP